MPPKPLRIAELPKCLSYGPDALDNLQAKLNQLTEETLITAVTSPEDVVLSDACRTLEGNYRLSTLALQQICSLTASGLSTLIADMAGLRRTRARAEATISIADAVRILNLCVRRRFNMQRGLYNRQFVINTRLQRIDGVLGSGYRYLPHSDLLNAIIEAMSSHTGEPQFERATLIGRYLTMIWRSSKAVMVTPDKMPVYVGYYVTNSEAGECSVGAAAALLLGSGAYRALLPVTQSNRTIHAGRAFGRKLAVTIGTMLIKGEEIGAEAGKLQRLAELPLQLIDDKGELRKGRIKKLAGRLARAGIRRDIAHEVVRLTAWGGGQGGIPVTLSAAAAAGRTGYDLFARLCHTASTYPHELREALERVAFELLRGNIRLEL